MEIASKYNPAQTEDKWYAYWMEKGFLNQYQTIVSHTPLLFPSKRHRCLAHGTHA